MKVNPLNIPIGSSYLVDSMRESAEEGAKKKGKERESNKAPQSAESQKSAPEETKPAPQASPESQILDTEKTLRLLGRRQEVKAVPKKAFDDGQSAKRLTEELTPTKKI